MDVVSALLIALSGIVIVFLMLIVLCLMIPIISKVVQAVQKKPAAAPAAAPAPAPAPAPAAAGAVGGEVMLVDVDEKTAACIMAIVSHETGIPLNELIFKKIKAV